MNLNMSLMQDESRIGEKSKGCLFLFVIVDGILESTHLMGCSGTNRVVYITVT